MKYIIITGFLFSVMQLRAQLYLSNGADLKLTGNSLITLHDISLVNNGTFNVAAGEGVVRFSGTGNHTIGGNNPVLFDILEVAKTGTARVSLGQHLNIGSSINFISGALDLNANNIFLNPSAVLNGESETSRIIGPNGGYVQITTVLNNPVIADPGNLGAIISSSANMGTTIIRRGHQSQTNNGGAGNSIFRYFDIQPANNTALNATLHIRYFDAELNNLTESSLTLWKSSNTLNWVDQGFNRRSAVTNYVEKSGVESFSRWTISSAGNALPVVFGLFHVTCNNDKVEIHWKTLSEHNSSYFEVQRSINGTDWVTVGTIPAAGNSSLEKSYFFTDVYPLAGTVLYRIAEFDVNGRIQYTGLIRNQCDQPSGIRLWPNPTAGDLSLSIRVQQSMNADVLLLDLGGRVLSSIRTKLLTGDNQLQLQTDKLPAGTYSLMIIGEDGFKIHRKFIKQ